MKKSSMIKALLALSLGMSASFPVWAAPAPPAPAPKPEATVSPWTGKYKVWIGDEKTFHQNTMEIVGTPADEVQINFVFDKGIGNETREPGPDEKLLNVTARGKRIPSTSGYLVETAVGAVQPVLYRIELYPLTPGKSWAGSISEGNQKYGIYARKDGQTE